MPYRKDPLAKDYFYHVYNRGNNRQNIFFEERNYLFFLQRIRENITEFSEVVAYCLMPNHYHFIIKIIEADKFVKGIKKTLISYSKAINSYRQRSGHLFEGRYKYKIIPDNNYLLHLSRYVHLNPVRAGLVIKASNWTYSSYNEFINKRKIDFIKPEIVLSQISDYFDFVESYQEEHQYLISNFQF